MIVHFPTILILRRMFVMRKIFILSENYFSKMCFLWFQILGQLTFLLPEYSKEVADAVWVRRDEIRIQLVKRTSEISHAYLKDFDWQLKVGNISLYWVSITTRSCNIVLCRHLSSGQVEISLVKKDLKNHRYCQLLPLKWVSCVCL